MYSVKNLLYSPYELRVNKSQIWINKNVFLLKKEKKRKENKTKQKKTKEKKEEVISGTIFLVTVRHMTRVPLLSPLGESCTHRYISVFKKFFLLFNTRFFTLSLSHTLLSFSPTHFIKHLTYTLSNSHFLSEIMSTTSFEFNGANFVTNNIAAILDNDEVPKEFHLIQDFLGSQRANVRSDSTRVYFSLTGPHILEDGTL